MNKNNSKIKPTTAGLALLLLVPAPTIGVLSAMWYLKDFPIAQDIAWLKDFSRGNAIWAFSKVWLIAFPLVWLLCVDRGQMSMSPLPKEHRRSGIVAGMVTGLVIFALILIGYYTFAKNWIDPAAVREHLVDVGLNSVELYLAMCVFWIVVNSAVEEYVWRWFVYTRFAAVCPTAIAAIFSGLAFTLHHVFALGFNFQWDWRIVTLASVGVFVGGVTWSILYARYRSVWVGWISHAWADLAIFIIGYQLLFSST